MGSKAEPTTTLDSRALDFAPLNLAVQHQAPSPLPRVILYCLIALFTLLLLWAFIGKLDVVASAEGKLVPQSYVKIVQPADGGIVKEILVKEGDAVQAGQVLMRMDGNLSQADTRIIAAEVKRRELQLRRIDAELSAEQSTPLTMAKDDDPNLFGQIHAQYRANRQAYQDALAQERALLTKAQEDLRAAREIERKLAQLLPSYQAQESAWQKLGDEGFAGRLMVQEKQSARIETEQNLSAQRYSVRSLQAAVEQSQMRFAQISSNYRQQLQAERVQTQAELTKLNEEAAKQAHKNQHLALKAPQAGIIKELATHTPGSVVSPGTILMTLVPIDEPLQAEVLIKNEDVGFIQQGDTVKLKLAAYPFQKYGLLEGRVSHIGADAAETPARDRASTQRGEQTHASSPYKAIVTLQGQELKANGKSFALTPGMQVIAEIHQGTRTIIDYLLSPVRGTIQEAGRER